MKNSTQSSYDLIGDIHGHYGSLISLLETLGYEARNGVYRHLGGRKVIFLGDFIDRGTNSLDVLRVARRMVEAGEALAVMGNHEFNFVSYLTPDGRGGYLREHSAENARQVSATMDSFIGRPQELTGHLAWMKSLPFFLELDGLRVVHASWVAEDIEFLRDQSLTDGAFLAAANEKGSRAYEAIERVLKGVEARLPDGVTLPDANGRERDSLRVKWWTPLAGKTWREIAFPPREDLPDGPARLSAEVAGDRAYTADLPPVFIGHYKLTGRAPFAAATNIASLDYGLGHGGKATAYRWDGESEIDPAHFVQVDAERDVAFEVWVDDNWHFMAEDERYSGGRYATYEEALRRAHEIVDRSLEESYLPGITAPELHGRYTSYGEDPWLVPTPDGVERFSAWSYAEERAWAFLAERDGSGSEKPD